MNFEKIKIFFIEKFQKNLNDKSKLYITLSLGWIILIGYLTWWNGLKSMSLDNSFRWDEWFWFGVVPALSPYLFYFIWNNKKASKSSNDFKE